MPLSLPKSHTKLFLNKCILARTNRWSSIKVDLRFVKYNTMMTLELLPGVLSWHYYYAFYFLSVASIYSFFLSVVSSPDDHNSRLFNASKPGFPHVSGMSTMLRSRLPSPRNIAAGEVRSLDLRVNFMVERP